MLKKRILVPISFSFSIRYLYRTGLMHQLRAFAEPVVAITWNEPELIAELRKEGFEIHVIPVSEKDKWYGNIRTKIDFWFDAFALKGDSKEVQKKYLNQYVDVRIRLRKKMRERYNYAKLFIPGYKKKLFDTEEQMLPKHTNYHAMVKLIEQLKIDAVFTVTPFHAQEDIMLRACKAMGKKMITAILSFDNITKRGWIPVTYDHYMVWNKYNRDELLSIYPNAARKDNVTITGAPQFDFYFDKKNLLKKEAWKRICGLPDTSQKIILYAGGPQILFPNEPQYLKHILEAIQSGDITGNPIVLFRCHPVDNVERWKDYVGDSANLFYDISWTGKEKLSAANITPVDIAKLCSTLAYTDVHINLCSTMTVDGSAYGKPQIGPYYDEVNPAKASLLRGMYNQQHFQPIIKSNGLRLADSKKEMIAVINEALQSPQNFIGHSERVLKEIITYTDGQCTSRVAAVIKQVLQ